MNTPFLLFAEAASIFFFMFIQLLARKKQPLHYCMVIGSFALGSVLLHSWAAEAGLIAGLPVLAYGDIAATFLAAPAFYLSSLTILHDGRRPVRSYALYFVLPTVFAVCAALFGLVAMAYALSRSAVFYFSGGRASGPAARPEWDRLAPELTARLELLMESSALYRDPALSLQRLAHALGVEPKRLSYHLHTVFSMTFRTYLNEWRLKAVCRDLCAASHRSILHTAFENGFNSKSSFNTLFYQKYGRTPREFRRENLHSTERRMQSARGIRN
jgi:AraC-like DNA-binding protein